MDISKPALLLIDAINLKVSSLIYISLTARIVVNHADQTVSPDGQLVDPFSQKDKATG